MTFVNRHNAKLPEATETNKPPETGGYRRIHGGQDDALTASSTQLQRGDC